MIKAVKPVVVGIGEILWDILPTGKSAGGAPVNFVYHAVRQGPKGTSSARPGRTFGEMKSCGSSKRTESDVVLRGLRTRREPSEWN